jgi:hypothetical protein
MHKVGSKIDRLILLCFIIRIWVSDTADAEGLTTMEL